MNPQPLSRKLGTLDRRRSTGLDDPHSLCELVQRLKEGIYVTSKNGKILDANPAFLDMLGVSSLAELQSLSAMDVMVDPAQRAREVELLDRNGSVRDYELQIRRPDGQLRTVIDTAYASIDPHTGEPVYRGILVDISERKRLEQQLVELSIRDPLTGCYNRRYLADFERRLGESPWGCVAIDIDYFKEFNDRFGHQVGDDVLVRVSRFLMRHTRAEEGVVRMGGDEFVVLLANSDAEQTQKLTSRLRSAGEREAGAPFSLGWAARYKNERLEATLHRADQHLIDVRTQTRPPEEERRVR